MLDVRVNIKVKRYMKDLEKEILNKIFMFYFALKSISYVVFFYLEVWKVY